MIFIKNRGFSFSVSLFSYYEMRVSIANNTIKVYITKGLEAIKQHNNTHIV